MAATAVNLKLNGCLTNANLTRNLERIFEDCARSGELKLSNRKLKEFPKTYGKFNLGDTTFADLSRNRFCELPEDITTFIFLEQLFLHQNIMKVVPQSIRNLTSLTFLDLRSNQLVSLPREICFLPIQILLVSNNKLVQLPEELGKMSELTELDAGVNQLSHLPSRICELTKLRSLCLRNNQINFLPKEIHSMNLVSLDLSCNKIASLPLEMRFMTELIDLNLTDNPLTSPPAQLCSKGTVFIFKYLENLASKDGMRDGGSNSLRRSIGRKSSHQIYDNIKPKNNISPDSVDLTFDPLAKLDIVPTSFHLRTELSKSDTSTPTQGFPSALNDALLLDNDLLKRKLESRTIIKSDPTSMNNISMLPDAARPESNHKTPEKLKTAADNIQTYREYKEALRQQRSNDIYSIYRCRDTQMPIERSNSDNCNLNGNKGASPTSNNGTNVTLDVCDNGKNLHSNGNGNGVDDNTYMKPNSPLKLIKTNGQQQQRPPTSNANMNGTKGHIRNKITSNARLWDGEGNEKLSFTMRREFDRHREEAELMKQLKNIIETKLKMSMPADIGQALNDGVVLCHLANHVKAQSVGSIHVPSANVPKLTMARCRRNVDNFLEACRKIGVDEANDVPLSPTLLEQALEIYEESATNTDNNTICPCQHCQPHGSNSLDRAMQKTIKAHEVSDYDRKLSNFLLLMFVLSLSIATAISLWPY